MDIVYRINDLPLFKSDNVEELKKAVEDFFQIQGAKPDVTIDGDFVRVHIDTIKLQEAEDKFKKGLDLCNKGKLKEAIPMLEDSIRICPQNSQAHRNLAQAYFMTGRLEDAKDTCIDALRWNPKDVYGIVLMGNILRQQGDLETASIYYERSLELQPDDALSSVNLATVYLELKKYEKAIALYEKALSKEKSFLNAYYGLSLCYMRLGSPEDFKKAFDIALDGLLHGVDRPENPGVRKEVIALMKATAEKLSMKSYQYIIDAAVDKIHMQDKTEIRFEEDIHLQVSAKMQYSKLYGRNYHLVLYNTKKPYVEHLKMHELMHLDMYTLAHNAHKMKLVSTNKEQTRAFFKKFSPLMRKVQNSMDHDKFVGFMDSLCSNLVLQLMNCPLDLLVEDKIYNEYKPLRPLQMLSLFAQELENVQSIQKAMSSDLIAKPIVTASKVMNMVTSMHLKELYGVDVIGHYKPTKLELDRAKDLYEEYKAYEGYKPGEEFELVSYFIESLDLEDFAKLSDEDVVLRMNGLPTEDPELEEEILDTAEEADSDEYNKKQKEEQKKFEQEHKGNDPMLHMMMSMYMVDALQTFDSWTKEEVNKTAFEIAMLGMQGFKTDQKSGYSVPSLPGKDMGGYQMIAYYYVSWAIAQPHMLSQLGLGMFDEAYESAKELFNSKKKGDL